MILTETQLNELSLATKTNLLFLLYNIEDELEYNCDEVTKTINYLQEVLK